jgi:2-desacetyl-2-hydroxyethyl bacteriochlorophyllide A dehydrogenase
VSSRQTTVHNPEMPNDMQALTITGPGSMELRTVERPQPAPSEVLIEVAYVGVCGTDAHLLEGDSSYLQAGYTSYPFVFGHEYSGVVRTVGAQTHHVRSGDRVVGHCMVPCNVCDMCQKGRRNLCRSLREVGLRYLQGAAATFLSVPETAVTVLPDALPLKVAPLIEPGVTALHACQRVQVSATDRVAVLGTGTLGLLAAMFAGLHTSQVDVVGIAPSELEFARSLGVRRALHVTDAAPSSYDVVVETSGAPPALAMAASLADLGGRLALVGLPGGASTGVDQSLIALKDLTIHGILHGIDNYGRVAELFASGQVRADRLIAGTFSPEKALDAFAQMGAGVGRTAPKSLVEFRVE